jgi:hypothetical protein
MEQELTVTFQHHNRLRQGWPLKEMRAYNLLSRHLTPAQQSSLYRHGWFEVVVGRRWHRRRFRIGQNWRLHEVRKDGLCRHYCILAIQAGLPEADWMLTVKLLLEGDPQRFFNTAHVGRYWLAH